MLMIVVTTIVPPLEGNMLEKLTNSLLFCLPRHFKNKSYYSALMHAAQYLNKFTIGSIAVKTRELLKTIIAVPNILSSYEAFDQSSSSS